MKVEKMERFELIVQVESKEEAKALERALYVVTHNRNTGEAFKEACNANSIVHSVAYPTVEKLWATLFEKVWDRKAP